MTFDIPAATSFGPAERPTRSKSKESKVGWIVPGVDRYDAQPALHSRHGDFDDCGGSLFQSSRAASRSSRELPRAAASRSTRISPPSSPCRSLPSTSWASVTVNSAPPRP
jgi:hypothetical protein